MIRRRNRVERRRNRSAIKRRRRLSPERLEGRWMLAATNILTYLGDLSGTGANTNESVLTPANVNSTQFGKQFTSAVDGQVYAQPLYMANVNITTGANQGIHNVVFVATCHDSLYAFDADNGVKLWQTSFLSASVAGVLNVNPNVAANVVITSVPAADVGSTNISPEIGVVATPVIDPGSGTIYLTAKTKEIINGNLSAPDYFYQLYAINIQNGQLQNLLGGGVIKIGDTVYSGGVFTNNTSISVAATTAIASGQSGGIIKFNTLKQMDRPGVTLYNGQIYTAWGSHGDQDPYHGWVTAYSASSLQLTGVFNATPGDKEGGIWQSGGRIEVDAAGALYFETGNGGFAGITLGGNTPVQLDANGFPVDGDYGDAVVKLVVDPTTTAANPGKNGWGLKVADYFAPFNQQNLDNDDTDMASSGLVILPDSVGSTTHQHLLIARGKSGVIYLIDRDTGKMGKYSSTSDNVVQEFSDSGGFWSSPTFAVVGSSAYFYGTPNSGPLQQWSVANAAFSTSVLHSSPDSFPYPGATGFISENGSANGIIWELDLSTNQLRAYNAANVSTEIYTSGQNFARDALGSAIKYTVPIVDNGRVYVGTANSLVVYGELVSVTQAPAAPTNLAATGLNASQIQLTWTRNSTNEAGFYVERSANNVNFFQVGLADAGATTFIDSNSLTPSTTYYYRVRAFNSIGNSSYSNVATGTSLLGIAGVWADRDIGTPNATGGAAFANNTFTVSGSGNDIWNTSDNFHLVYQPLTGDGTIIAQVITQGNSDPWAKAGAMIRESLNGNSTFADVVVTPGNGVVFQDRTTTGAAATWPTGTGAAGTAPYWVMLVRAGNTFTGYASSNGVNYTKLGSDTFTMAQTVFVGLAVTSHNDGVLSTATFNNVSVFPPQTFVSDLTPTSSTNGSGPIHTDKSQNGNTITLRGTSYAKGLGVQANSDVVYNLAGGYTSFISDIGIDDEVGASGAAEFQVFADGNKVFDSGSTLLAGGGAVGHIVVNVTGVNSLDLRVIDGAGNSNDHADWAAARLINGLPGAANSLSGTVAGGSQINLTWTDTAVNENAYKILRQDPNSSTFHVIGSVPPRTTSYIDGGLTNGQTYSYEVQATNTVGDSAVSNIATVLLPSPPAAPTNLHLTQLTTTTVGLAWQIPPTNDQGVKVFRRDTTTSLYSLIATLPADTTSYINTGLTPGSLHDYNIQTYNIGGFSGPASLEVTLLTVAPTGPTAVSGNGHIQLNWTAPNGAMTYNVYRGISLGGENAAPLATGVSTNSYQDASVASGSTYYYQVTAVDPGGESARSAEVHAVFVAPIAVIPSPVPNPSVVAINSLQIVFNEAVSGFTRSSLSLTFNNGSNLLTSSQTLTTSDNSTFTLGNLAALTAPVGAYTLTFTAAGSGVTDAVGNTATSNSNMTFVITHAAPQVAAVYIDGGAWQQSFLNYLASTGQGDAQLGYRIPSGAGQLGSLPWTNVNIITVQFTEDVTINTAQAGLALVGSPDLAPAPALSTASFNYSSATRTATWTFPAALPLDKYLISIPSVAVTNGLGANLDGEFTTSASNFPSGDGTAGGDFNFRFNLLPGDVDQNGIVTGPEGGDVRQHFLQFASSPGYIGRYDTYGKGAITGLDLMTVQAALLTQLPATDPSPPGQGGGGGGGSGSIASPAVAPAVAALPAVVASPTFANTSNSAAAATASIIQSSTSNYTTAASTATSTEDSTPSTTQAPAAVTPTTVDSTLSLSTTPVPLTSSSSPHDLVLESLGADSASTASRFSSVLHSFTSLNSLSLSSVSLTSAARHGGWLRAHDSLFAEIEFSGLVSATRRSSPAKRLK